MPFKPLTWMKFWRDEKYFKNVQEKLLASALKSTIANDVPLEHFHCKHPFHKWRRLQRYALSAIPHICQIYVISQYSYVQQLFYRLKEMFMKIFLIISSKYMGLLPISVITFWQTGLDSNSSIVDFQSKTECLKNPTMFATPHTWCKKEINQKYFGQH